MNKKMTADTKIAILATLVGTLAFLVLWFWVDANHYKNHCEGHKTGKCGWAWCKYYDGSDYLHDFSF